MECWEPLLVGYPSLKDQVFPLIITKRHIGDAHIVRTYNKIFWKIMEKLCYTIVIHEFYAQVPEVCMHCLYWQSLFYTDTNINIPLRISYWFIRTLDVELGRCLANCIDFHIVRTTCVFDDIFICSCMDDFLHKTWSAYWQIRQWIKCTIPHP